MKKIKKTSCNNQGIKRFLSPQPSNIPCKKQCKQIDLAADCTTRKSKDSCHFSSNTNKKFHEIEKTKHNLQVTAVEAQNSSAKDNTPHKFDWNSFVRDPAEMQESRYPVTFNTFKTMTHCFSVVNCILEDIKTATSLDFINDELMKERVLKNYYIQFYENPQIRNIYKLETKACPTFVKKKIMQIPTLENIVVKDSNSNAPEVANANIAPVEVVSKPKELCVTAAPTAKTVVPLEAASKPVELERVEAQSSKAQANEMPQQAVAAKSRDHANTLYISKNLAFMHENFLRRHISRKIQDVEKQEIILARINAELLQRKNAVQTNAEKPKDTQVLDLTAEVLIDISESTEVPATVITKEQRIAQAKNLFLKEYAKSNTLAYALRFHNGLKRHIISAILEMSIDEFKKYTKIHNASEIYDDPNLLRDCYNYAIKTTKIWPVNLYMQLCDLFAYLKSKSVAISVDNLEDISPMLLHWTELAVLTNFDEIMKWDYYRCKGEKFGKFAELEAYRELFYEKCWLHNTWLREVPKLNVEVQKQLTTVMEVVECDIINEEVDKNSKSNETAAENVKQSAVEAETVHEAAINDFNVATTEQRDATIAEPTNLMDAECVEPVVNTLSVTSNAAIAEHSPDTSAGHLVASNETLLTQNIAETTTIAQTTTLNAEQNTLTAATANLETTTAAVLEATTNSNETMLSSNREITDSTETTLSSNREIEAQQRIQTAKQLYFYEVEKSCTLPYLLRLHTGLKRRILNAILHMTYTEFRQYTHIHDAAEIYKNNELLQHCYDFVVKRPQVWPVNLYMRLVDLYEFLKTKDITLTAADLTHVSPKLLHWQDLSATTNYDYIVYWDYYRCSGKKMHQNKNLPNSYRQSFYEKCWYYDNWIWHTPRISDNVLSDVVAGAEEDKENAIFERAVVTHALAEWTEESETIEEVVTMEEESDTRAELPIVEQNVVENLVQPTSNARSTVSTVDAEIQTSQHLLATYSNSSNILHAPAVTAENPNPIILPSKAIKQEKLSPLDKLQFNLVNDEENYECVPVPDDIVDVEGSISADESQDELMLPLSNSENLAEHGTNLLLSFESPNDEVAQHTTQLTENMESERIAEQQQSCLLNDEPTQLLPECIMEVEIETNSTEEQQLPNITQQQQSVQQVEIQTESSSAVQGEPCSTQLQQQKQVNIGVQQVLSSEEAPLLPHISREVKQELLQQVQQPVDVGAKQQKQTQSAAQPSKTSHIEVATALTRIIEAHKLAKQQKQQHNVATNAQVTAPTQTKHQQQQAHEKCSVVGKQQQEKQRPKSIIENQRKQQQQQPPTAVTQLQQQHKKQQQKIVVEKQRAPTEQQPTQQQQKETSTTTIELQSKTKKQQLLIAQPKNQTSDEQRSTPQQQQQKPSPTVVLPSPTLQQQKEIAVEKQAARKQRLSVDQPTTQIQQQQQVAKSQKTRRKYQINEKPKTTKEHLESQQLAAAQQRSSQTVQLLSSQTSIQQQLQQQQQQQVVAQIENQMEAGFGAEKELQQAQQLVPQIVAKAADTLTHKETAQQLLLQQQLSINNKNENKIDAAAEKIIESIQQNREVQQQTTLESSNASKQTDIQFITQALPTEATAQHQFNQPQFILQRTSTQIQEQLVIRPAGGTHSQDTPINLPASLMKVANKQTTTTTTTKTKTVKPAKATTRKTAKSSDYVPQLTHVFQPLAVALNTKKAATPPPPINNELPQTTATTSNLQPLHSTPATEEAVHATSNITASPSNANTMVLTLPVSMNVASTSASNSSYVYSLSGDSTFFNNSELLKVLENYQLQQSQQKQQQSQQQQSQQQLTQPEQLSQQPQTSALENYQLQRSQQQQTQTHSAPVSQQQSADLVYMQMAQLHQQQCEQIQQEQQFELYNQLQVIQQQQQQQQHYQAAIEVPQPLALMESVTEQQQQQLQQLQAYQLLLQQQQQQPIVFQLVDFNQAPHAIGEQYMQLLCEEQTQTPNLHEASSTNRMQQQSTLVTKEFAQQTNTNEMLQVNIWLEHNYAMPCPPTPRTLTPLPSPKGVCRMRTRPPLKPFFYQRLEKLDYFGELTAQNIADYQLQCTSLGKPYLQAKIRTTRLRTVLSGDILAALLPRYAPDLVKNLHLLLQYLGEFHFNTWEQRQQRKLISKCAHRTLHTLCAHILLLFFEYSTPFQVKCLELAEEKRAFNGLSVATASALRVKTVDMLDDLSLAIEPCILTEMAALKRNL